MLEGMTFYVKGGKNDCFIKSKSSLGLDVTGTGPLYTALGHTSTITSQHWMISQEQLYHNC